jgi:hypothetical protein
MTITHEKLIPLKAPFDRRLAISCLSRQATNLSRGGWMPRRRMKRESIVAVMGSIDRVTGEVEASQMLMDAKRERGLHRPATR